VAGKELRLVEPSKDNLDQYGDPPKSPLNPWVMLALFGIPILLFLVIVVPFLMDAYGIHSQRVLNWTVAILVVLWFVVVTVAISRSKYRREKKLAKKMEASATSGQRSPTGGSNKE
jgi:membrane protein YdbS with pleckstrin-like domain